MEDILYKYCLSTKIIAAVMSMYSCTTARVMTAKGCSADLEVEADVLQDDKLDIAPIYLFVIVEQLSSELLYQTIVLHL